MGVVAAATGFWIILSFCVLELTLFHPGRDQAATSLCSQGLLVPTLGQMLRAPLKPGQVAMPSTLVELVKSFNLFENTFD